MTKKEFKKSTNFDLYLQKLLKDPELKKYYDEVGKQLEIAYQILQLRKKQGISQSEFAKKIGTTQSNVARLEAGNQNFTTETLQKIAKAFKRELKVEFV
jgi:ribosome-binding protein aMBF1 (putative translation factor)